MTAARAFDPRRAAIAKVKMAAKVLGLDDAAYRAMLERITGRTSAADCTLYQLGSVLDEMKAKGWRPSSSPYRSARGASLSEGGAVIQGGRKAPAGKAKPAASPIARKARAIWISLHQLGEIRDPSERALEAFAKRQLGVERLNWAVASESNALIEALKAMADRAGWSQDLAGVPAALHVEVLKARLAAAIEARTSKAGRG